MKKCRVCGAVIPDGRRKICDLCRKANGHRVNRCKLCGKVIEPKKQYCEDCKKEKRAASQASLYERYFKKEYCGVHNRTSKQKAKPPKPQKIDTTQCRSCLFRMHLLSDYNTWQCGYLYYTGHMRPCDPSPDCTAYRKSSRSKRLEQARRAKKFSCSRGGQEG